MHGLRSGALEVFAKVAVLLDGVLASFVLMFSIPVRFGHFVNDTMDMVGVWVVLFLA